MTFNDIYTQFTKSTKENFPIENCIKQNKEEFNVFDSDTPYLCFVIDKGYDNWWKMVVLYPYICKETETITTFGWTDRSGNIYCNIENSTQLWDEFVIGFKPYTEDSISYKQLWDGFIQKIDDQYND